MCEHNTYYVVHNINDGVLKALYRDMELRKRLFVQRLCMIRFVKDERSAGARACAAPPRRERRGVAHGAPWRSGERKKYRAGPRGGSQRRKTGGRTATVPYRAYGTVHYTVNSKVRRRSFR